MSKTSVSLEPAKEESVPKKITLKNLKDLIFLGRIDRTVECGGYNFLMKSITAEDQKNMVAKILKEPEDLRILNAKIISVAFSVEKVNGALLEDLYEEENIDASMDKFDKKIFVIKQLQLSVVNKLYKNYEEIFEESNSGVDIEEIKK